MITQTLVTCNGKINQHGFCDKCYQPAHTTSNQCGRLVPYQPTEINTLLAVSGLPDIYSGALNTERISKYRKLAKDYNIQEGTVRDIFCAGADWALSQAACASGGEAQSQSDGFYCADWNRCGAICEEQCPACKKADRAELL